MNEQPEVIVKELVKILGDFCDLVAWNPEFKATKETVDELVDCWDILEQTGRELYRRVPKK